jgi:predicted acyl esterase
VIVERDVPVRVSDGNILRVNVFCPPSVAPVVMSMTPYGKDKTPDRIGMRVAGGRIALSADFFQPEQHRDDQCFIDTEGTAVSRRPIDTGEDCRTD